VGCVANLHASHDAHDVHDLYDLHDHPLVPQCEHYSMRNTHIDMLPIVTLRQTRQSPRRRLPERSCYCST